MRYFFDTQNGGFHADPEGTNYPSTDVARQEATMYAGEILRDHPDEVWESDELIVTVKDDRGLILFTVTVLTQRSSATMG
jgi:hypothetical protein